MVTYGDYFSRKVLHNCGVSPTQILFHKDETPYPGTQRTENIRSKMAEIYQTLYRGYTDKNSTEPKEGFDSLQIKNKIISAFYDSGVLSNVERDYFQTQDLQGLNDRERLCVEEANLSVEKVKVERVDAQRSNSLERKM
jgi:hypothetical protein